MVQIPSINQFLEEVDPEKTIDRQKAMAEISSVVLLWAIRDTKGELNHENQEQLEKFLKDQEKFDFGGIYGLFDKAGKKEKLLQFINDNINKVRIDYIKTHLEAMAPEEREKVFAKFPTLKELLTPTPTI